MTLSSSMAMYSVMRDIPNARKVPMERGWVALHLYATCKFSNLLTLEQWAFEYGLPFFWYALYMPYISRGFYFREFRESGAIREFSNTRKIFTSDPDAWMRLVYAILVVQYTLHVQGRIANFVFWKWVNDKYWFLRPLLSSSIANLTSRKNVAKNCLLKYRTFPAMVFIHVGQMSKVTAHYVCKSMVSDLHVLRTTVLNTVHIFMMNFSYFFISNI